MVCADKADNDQITAQLFVDNLAAPKEHQQFERDRGHMKKEKGPAGGCIDVGMTRVVSKKVQLGDLQVIKRNTGRQRLLTSPLSHLRSTTSETSTHSSSPSRRAVVVPIEHLPGPFHQYATLFLTCSSSASLHNALPEFD